MLFYRVADDDAGETGLAVAAPKALYAVCVHQHSMQLLMSDMLLLHVIYVFCCGRPESKPPSLTPPYSQYYICSRYYYECMHAACILLG